MSGAPQDGRRENRQTSDLFGASPCEGAVAVPHGHDGADIFLGGDCHILDESQGSRLATGSAGADRAGEVAALVACRCGRGLRGQRARTMGAELGDEGPGAERVLQGGTQTPVRPPLTRGDHGDRMLGSAVAVGGEQLLTAVTLRRRAAITRTPRGAAAVIDAPFGDGSTRRVTKGVARRWAGDRDHGVAG